MSFVIMNDFSSFFRCSYPLGISHFDHEVRWSGIHPHLFGDVFALRDAFTSTRNDNRPIFRFVTYQTLQEFMPSK